MALEIKAITPLYPHGFFIQWSIKEATESGEYTFDVYRSGWKEGPWELIARGLSNRYAYVDRFGAPALETTESVLQPNQLALYRPFWYRVVVTTPAGNALEDVDSFQARNEGAINDNKMSQYHRKATRDFRLSLKFNGTKCAILKRKHWGVRCDCVDKKTREIVRSSCRKCWGAGIVGGYWAPHISYARRSVTTNASAITPQGKSDATDTKFWMPDFPSLENEDVILFLRDKSRWRVDQTVGTEIRLHQVHQVVSAQVIDRSHILYQFPVDPDVMEAIF